MKINIITLGCSKNTVDSENLAGHLAANHEVHFDRSGNDCDCVIINTCGFIGDAKEESVNVLLEQTAAKKRFNQRHRAAEDMGLPELTDQSKQTLTVLYEQYHTTEDFHRMLAQYDLGPFEKALWQYLNEHYAFENGSFKRYKKLNKTNQLWKAVSNG